MQCIVFTHISDKMNLSSSDKLSPILEVSVAGSGVLGFRWEALMKKHSFSFKKETLFISLIYG